MFTGLVRAVGTVLSADPAPGGARLTLDPGPWTHRPEHGESIAVSGCCLTIVGTPAPGEPWAFDVIHETLAKTKLGALRPGSRVNLEPSVTASTLMGGHFVQGHVDGVGTIARITRPDASGGEWRLRVAPPDGLMLFVTPKGSVCVDGTSLTVAALDPGDRAGAGGWFEVALIPTTLRETTLGDLAEGDPVNLEADILAKTVVHYTRHYAR